MLLWTNDRVLLKYLAVKNWILTRNIRWKLRAIIAVWGTESDGLWGKPIVFQRNCYTTSKPLIWFFTTSTMALYDPACFSDYHLMRIGWSRIWQDGVVKWSSRHAVTVRRRNNMTRIGISSGIWLKNFSVNWKSSRKFPCGWKRRIHLFPPTSIWLPLIALR